MITVFNREKLMADTSSQELNRVTDILRKNEISYDVVTKKNMRLWIRSYILICPKRSVMVRRQHRHTRIWLEMFCTHIWCM